MPIYEFYCTDCNTIFNFFSHRVNIEKRPMCPKCNKGPLDRLISRFSFLKGTEEQGDMGMPELDETKVQRALSLLEREAKDINEDDPRQAAHLIHRLFDTTGMNLGSGIEEALRRMEAGEDPDKIEKEMGDVLSEDIFKASPKAFRKGRRKPPERDETLYCL
jgi:putative FmdB family regulatory protein